MIVNKYPDGSSYTDWNKIPLETTFRINSYEDLWHLNQLLESLNANKMSMVNITIPNLIDAQADRRFGAKQSSGLKLVCKMLNQYPNKFKIFHPHNPEVVEALMDNVKIIDNSEFIADVLYKIGEKEEHDLILMSSDAGGFKPLMKLCDQLDWKGETFSASKARTKDGMKQLIDREDFGGKDILIVDDLCVKGGTFKGLSKMLKERNCGKLYLAVSHMTVQNLGKDPVTNYYDKVFTTNSKYSEYHSCENYMMQKSIIPENLGVIKQFK